MQLTAIPKRRLVDEVLEQLQRMLQSGAYKYGDKLPSEPELMKLLDVGRSTVREAVKILVHAGQLEVKQGDGTYVKSPSIELTPLQKTITLSNYLQILEVRSLLEEELAFRAAERRTLDQLLEMENALTARKNALDLGLYTEYVEADIQFHMAVAAASHNEILVAMYSIIVSGLREMLSQLILDTKMYDDQSSYHEAIYKAIADQDADSAKQNTKLNLLAAQKRWMNER